MGRRFITARDIDDLFDRGETELRVDATTVLTDLARERARERGLRVTAAGAGVAPPARTSAGDGGGAGASGRREVASATAGSAEVPAAAVATAADDGPTRRQLRAAVRAAVIAEFGTTPDGIDVAIGRVFDRFGVTD
jgi:hypothetical protein